MGETSCTDHPTDDEYRSDDGVSAKCRSRLSCALGMLSSLGVKVPCPT
jgi:hypothetical protein